MKTIALSVLSLALASTAVAAPARPTVSEGTIARLREYDQASKTHLFGPSGVHGKAPQALRMFSETLLPKLQLKDQSQITALKAALTVNPADPSSPARVERQLDALVSVAAARQVAVKMQEKPGFENEVKLINESADAVLKTVENSIYTRSADVSKLSAEERAQQENLSLAVEKLESLTGQIIGMKGSAREIFQEVALKRDELLASGKFTGEEALIQSIMSVRKVSREDALKIAEKLRTCK